MFTGTFIGGSINFNAIALSYEVTKVGELYAGTVVVDNIDTMIWMQVTLAVPRLMMASKGLTDRSTVSAAAEFAAPASIGELAYRLALFVGIILTVHGLFIFGVGRLFKQDWELLAIALCRTFNRPELFLPAILIGSLGNGLGTSLGFLVAGLTK